MPLPIATERDPIYTDVTGAVLSTPLSFSNSLIQTAVPSINTHLARLGDIVNGMAEPVFVKIVDYTIIVGTDGLILVDATAGPVIITLPVATAAFLGASAREFTVVKIDSSTNTVEVKADVVNPDTVLGDPSFFIEDQWGAATFQTDLISNWIVK